MARRRDLARERHRRGAAAAADIDHTLARLQLRPVDHEIGNRPEHDVLRRLPRGPALPGRSVPVGDLVGVLIVALGGVHGAVLLIFRNVQFSRNGVRTVRLRASSFGVTAFALHAPAGMPSRSAKREGW
jgi:hypothetical protein